MFDTVHKGTIDEPAVLDATRRETVLVDGCTVRRSSLTRIPVLRRTLEAADVRADFTNTVDSADRLQASARSETPKLNI